MSKIRRGGARYELTDEQWDLLKGLFPSQKRGGRWNDHRTTLNGMLWILRSGTAWRRYTRSGRPTCGTGVVPGHAATNRGNGCAMMVTELSF
jgi:transposase